MAEELMLSVPADQVRVGDRMRGGFLDGFEVINVLSPNGTQIGISAKPYPGAHDSAILTVAPHIAIEIYRAPEPLDGLAILAKDIEASLKTGTTSNASLGGLTGDTLILRLLGRLVALVQAKERES